MLPSKIFERHGLFNRSKNDFVEYIIKLLPYSSIIGKDKMAPLIRIKRKNYSLICSFNRQYKISDHYKITMISPRGLENLNKNIADFESISW